MTLSSRLHHTNISPVASDASSAAARQVFWLLRGGFTLLPIAFGLDKFANVLTEWSRYLAPWIDGLVPGSAADRSPRS